MLGLKLTASEVLEMAFAILKYELCNGVVVKLPNPNKPFVLKTYASVHALGAVLRQREG